MAVRWQLKQFSWSGQPVWYIAIGNTPTSWSHEFNELFDQLQAMDVKTQADDIERALGDFDKSLSACLWYMRRHPGIQSNDHLWTDVQSTVIAVAAYGNWLEDRLAELQVA